MPPRHVRRTPARPTPRRSIAASALLVCACSLPFALNATDRALADDSPSDGTIVADLPESRGNGVHSFARSARAVAQEAREQRIEERQERREARELRQERRERAERRADRAERRALAQWVMPISGAGWSAPFGQQGSMWSSGYHTGQDFTAPYGTSVVAASGGTITFAGWSDAYGNNIEITHPDGNQTWYAHLSDFAQTSGTVAPGDVIGYVGCTGNCYGNHLHFEFHPGGGEAADPISWLRSQGAL
jgi:murein DD-endopeptidase MepM/ murein hydrolase activator NlpD